MACRTRSHSHRRSPHLLLLGFAALASGGDQQPPPGVAPLMQAADTAFAKKDFATAHSTLEEVLALWPAEPMAHFKLGMLLSQSRTPADALPHFEQAAALLPHSHPMHGDVLKMLRRHQQKHGPLPPRRQRPQGGGPPVHVFTARDLLPAAAAAPTDPETILLAEHEVAALLAERQAATAGDSSPERQAELRRQDCEVARLEEPISLQQFLQKYSDTPLILGAQSGVGTLPFPITPQLIAEMQPAGALSECLCRPQHGTNFDDSPPGGAIKTQKRTCIWQLPLLLEMILGQRGGEQPPVTNLDLAEALAFQCRIGDGELEAMHGRDPEANRRLLQTILGSLGNDHALGSAAEAVAAGSSWWGANLSGRNFVAAVLWVASERTRTPIHADDQPQFLVQLHGQKHVTLFPRIDNPKESNNLIKAAWGRGGAFNRTAAAAEMAEAGVAFGDEAPGGVQRCLLKPGEVLWMPAWTVHDVFSLDGSVALNMRFQALDPPPPPRGRRRKGKRTGEL